MGCPYPISIEHCLECNDDAGRTRPNLAYRCVQDKRDARGPRTTSADRCAGKIQWGQALPDVILPLFVGQERVPRSTREDG